MGYKEMYEEWLNNPYFDDATKAELKAIEGNEKEIEDRFYMDLEVWYGRSPRRDRRRNKPYECLYSPQGNTGTCKLYQQCACTGERGSNCV